VTNAQGPSRRCAQFNHLALLKRATAWPGSKQPRLSRSRGALLDPVDGDLVPAGMRWWALLGRRGAGIARS
jgi:hypothetical protein